MKTSNKVLFGGLGLVVLFSVILAGFTRSTSTITTKEDCDKLPFIKKELDLTFESISATQNINVVLRQGDFKVMVECAEQNEPILNHHVEDGELKLYLERKDNIMYERGAYDVCPVKFTIQCPDLKQVYISNGASLMTEGSFTASDLDIRVQNGSRIEMDVRSDEVTVSAQNGANLTLAGEIKYLDAKGVNSSNITAKDADISKASIKLSNSAAATIHADTISQANLVNSSLLKYVGATQLEDVSTVNSSSIERVDN